MGVYVYKTKPTAVATVTVETPDGRRERMDVQVYEFAFKCYRYDEDARTWTKVCGPSERAFERRGTRPLPYGVSAYEGAMSLGEPVFPTRHQVAAVEISDQKPYGKVVAIHRGLKVHRPRVETVVPFQPQPTPVAPRVEQRAVAGEQCKPIAAVSVIEFE
jgi:hypothetical protein